jgi:hypothetical protein
VKQITRALAVSFSVGLTVLLGPAPAAAHHPDAPIAGATWERPFRPVAGLHL